MPRDQLAVDYEGKVKVTKLDVDANIRTATKSTTVNLSFFSTSVSKSASVTVTAFDMSRLSRRTSRPRLQN